jgi:ADP-ribose diphosphatase
MIMPLKKPKTLSREVVAKSKLFTVEGVDLQFTNGQVRYYERLVSKGLGAVMIVAMLDDDTVCLIREYGGGIDDYTLTLPKGAIDAGEDVTQAAHRELQEEVGYGAHKYTYIKRLSLSPSYMSGSINVVLAEDLYPSKLAGDEPEPLEVVMWKLSDLDALLSRDDFTEGRAIAALFLVKELIAKRVS